MAHDSTRAGKTPQVPGSTQVLAEGTVTLSKAMIRDGDNVVENGDAIRQEIVELQAHQVQLEMQNEELRRTQLELYGVHGRYFDLYDSAPVGYCTVSETGLIVEANLTASILFGVARQALIGNEITRFIHESAQDGFRLQCNRLFAQGAAVGFDLQMQKADGASFWVLLAATVERHLDQSAQLRLTLNDITARRETEALLQENQARYRNFLVTIDKGFCVLQLIRDAEQKVVDYRFLEVNPAFENQTGLRAVTGKRIRELVPDIEECWLNLYGNVALTGMPIRAVHEAKSMGRWFEVYASPYGQASSTQVPNDGVAVIFHDVTVRKKVEIRAAQLDQALHEKTRPCKRPRQSRKRPAAMLPSPASTRKMQRWSLKKPQELQKKPARQSPHFYPA